MTPVDELFTFSALVSLVTLAMLEIALGIDNVIFVSLILGRMPKEDRKQGRRLWVIFGILMRSGLLIGLTTLMKHGETTLFNIAGDGFSLRHVILFCGGIFLLYKAVMEIHDRIQGDPEISTNVKTRSFSALMVQVVLMDAIFSFDSILTAIGLGKHVEVMILAVVVAMIIMFYFAKGISAFIDKNPTFKILALSFLVLVGFMLFFEGLEPFHHSKIPKGYAYVAMGFSFGVELLNMKMRKKRTDQL